MANSGTNIQNQGYSKYLSMECLILETVRGYGYQLQKLLVYQKISINYIKIEVFCQVKSYTHPSTIKIIMGFVINLNNSLHQLSYLHRAAQKGDIQITQFFWIMGKMVSKLLIFSSCFHKNQFDEPIKRLNGFIWNLPVQFISRLNTVTITSQYPIPKGPDAHLLSLQFTIIQSHNNSIKSVVDLVPRIYPVEVQCTGQHIGRHW